MTSQTNTLPLYLCKTGRITRRYIPRKVRPFRVYGQPSRSRVHWHAHTVVFARGRVALEIAESVTEPVVGTLVRARGHAPRQVHLVAEGVRVEVFGVDLRIQMQT